MVANAYWAHLADLMARMAKLLGRRVDEARYRSLFERLCAVFREQFMEADGRIAGDTQTAYLLALDFGLVSGAAREQAIGHLFRKIDDADGHLQTGFLGVKHLCPVLADAGAPDRAYQLLLNEGYPSWGFSMAFKAPT
jgi:alpha-L-rhamnosidase